MERILKALVSPVGAAAEPKIRAVRGMYDLISDIYPLSSRLFHRDAHAAAIAMSEIKDGMKVLEVATGSGELFRQLTKNNTAGLTLGVDLSPRMASKTQRGLHGGAARAFCNAADIRSLPFRSASFDRVFVAMLLELLPDDTVWDAIRELCRVLKPDGRLIVVFISQRSPSFNSFYSFGASLMPSFLGRLVEDTFYDRASRFGLEIIAKKCVRQLWYPSTVVTMRKV